MESFDREQAKDHLAKDAWSDSLRGTIVPDKGWTQHYDLVKEMGDCHTSMGDYVRARQCYDKAAELAPDEAAPYVGLGVIHLQNGELEDAETAFRVACRLEPKSSKALCGLAMTAQRQGQNQRAFDGYLKTLEVDPDEISALLGLFQVSCQMGSFGQIIRYLELYLDMHPGDLSVMFSLAALHRRDGRIERARELLERIMLLEPNHSDARNLLEEIEHSMNDSMERRTTCLNPMR